jgi:hypothetical protein
MKLDWSAVNRDKQTHREKAAERPIAEKLRTLERLRDRAAAIKRAVANDALAKRPAEAAARRSTATTS